MSENKKNKAGLQKRISSVFKGVPIPQIDGVQEPSGTLAPEHTGKPPAQAAEAIAAAEAEAEEKVRSYATALAQAEEKLAKAEEKAKAEALTRVKAEEKARAESEAKAETERQARTEAEGKTRSYAKARAETEKKLQAQTQARVETEEKLKAEIQARHRAEEKAEVEAEEKVRSYATALAQAEEKLAKAEEKAKAEALTRVKAEESLKAESEEQQKVEALAAEAIQTFNRICKYVFQPRAIKRKIALISTIAIVSAIAFTVSMVKNSPMASYADTAIQDNPPVANSDAMTTHEDTPVVTIDVLANDTDINGDTLTVTAFSQGTNGSVTINPDSTLSYSPHANFYGNDAFTYTVSDNKGLTGTARVNVTVKMVNDAPVIASAPVTTATAGALYTYDVDSADPDVGDMLTYSLTTKPADMTINSTTGLIQWKPIQVGDNKVVVKVTDSNSTPALDTQSFTITVNPAPPKIAKLTVLDGYNQKNRKTLSADGKTNLVQSSDNDRWRTNFGSYISYDFSDVSIPADAAITSVVVFVEHFEEERYAQGNLEWAVGTGWPTKPVVWASIKAPVHEGQSHEAVDSWDVTSVVDTREKINSLQLQVKNNDNIANRKTLIDYTYVVVEWD